MIVIYKNNFSYKDLILNTKYVVSKIVDNTVFLIGFQKTFEKDAFVKEDNSNIQETNYINNLVLNKRNIEIGDKVLCVVNFGNNRVKVGEIYTVSGIETYKKSRNIELKIKIKDTGFRYTYSENYENYLDSNFFIKYNKDVERFQKLQRIFNDISLYTNK